MSAEKTKYLYSLKINTPPEIIFSYVWGLCTQNTYDSVYTMSNVYTVREFRRRLKEALDLAWAELEDDDFHITITRGNQTFLLFASEETAKVAPAVPETSDVCQGHQMRWDCGLKNCNQGRPAIK